MISVVFAYGSLQIPAVMHAVTRRHLASRPARLEGYARYRLKRRSYPGLRRRSGAATEGMLYYGVDRLALTRLDRFEDTCYRRQTLRVVIAPDGLVPAQVYVIPPRYYRLLQPDRWFLRQFRSTALKAYLRRCRRRVAIADRRAGASRNNLPNRVSDGRSSRVAEEGGGLIRTGVKPGKQVPPGREDQLMS